MILACCGPIRMRALAMTRLQASPLHRRPRVVGVQQPNVLWPVQPVDSDGLFSRACGGHGSEVLWLHSLAALRTLLTEARLIW